MRSARCGLEVRSARLGGGGRRPWPAHPPASRQVCAASVRAAGARRRRQLTVTRDVRAVRSVYRIIPGYLAVKVLLGARSLSTLLASGPRLHDAPVPLLIQGARREGPSVTHITIKKTIMPRDRRRSVLQLRHVCMVVCACPQGLSYLHEQIPSSSSPPWPPSDLVTPGPGTRNPTPRRRTTAICTTTYTTWLAPGIASRLQQSEAIARLASRLQPQRGLAPQLLPRHSELRLSPRTRAPLGASGSFWELLRARLLARHPSSSGSFWELLGASQSSTSRQAPEHASRSGRIASSPTHAAEE